MKHDEKEKKTRTNDEQIEKNNEKL